MLSVLTSLLPARATALELDPDHNLAPALAGVGSGYPPITIDLTDRVGPGKVGQGEVGRRPGRTTGWLHDWKQRLLTLAAQSLRPEGGGGSDETATTVHDPDQLHNLVVDYGDAVFRVALSVVKDRALAEDVAQETMVKAWMALPTFRGDSSLRSWILRIAHNTAISTLRQRRAVVLDPHDMPEPVDPRERSVETKVQSNLVLDEFAEALDVLDELSRSIVILRELEGLSYEEIVEILDVPLPTVKTRLLRARRKLSAALREWER
jgi:RNA polymerase sigma-70 factor (ECF subfamily)